MHGVFSCLHPVSLHLYRYSVKPKLPSKPRQAVCLFCHKTFDASPFGKLPRFDSSKCRTYWHRDHKRQNPELPLNGGAR